MTGLVNDRFLDEVANNEIQRPIRAARTIAIVLHDLDGLKNIAFALA